MEKMKYFGLIVQYFVTLTTIKLQLLLQYSWNVRIPFYLISLILSSFYIFFVFVLCRVVQNG